MRSQRPVLDPEFQNSSGVRVARRKEFDPDLAVEAAMDLFWANGYSATTPADLVAHLGIGRGSLYNAFHSKGELYRRALIHYRDATTARRVEILDGVGSPRDRLQRAVEAIVAHASTGEDQRGCLVTNAAIETAPHDPEVAALVSGVIESQVVAFRTVILQAQAVGEVDPGRSVEDLARYLVTFLNGVRVLQRAGEDPRNLRPLAALTLLVVMGPGPPAAPH